LKRMKLMIQKMRTVTYLIVMMMIMVKDLTVSQIKKNVREGKELLMKNIKRKKLTKKLPPNV